MDRKPVGSFKAVFGDIWFRGEGKSDSFINI